MKLAYAILTLARAECSGIDAMRVLLVEDECQKISPPLCAKDLALPIVRMTARRAKNPVFRPCRCPTFLYAKAKTASVINRRRAEVRGSFLALHRDSDNEEARAPLSKGRC